MHMCRSEQLQAIKAGGWIPTLKATIFFSVWYRPDLIIPRPLSLCNQQARVNTKIDTKSKLAACVLFSLVDLLDWKNDIAGNLLCVYLAHSRHTILHKCIIQRESLHPLTLITPSSLVTVNSGGRAAQLSLCAHQQRLDHIRVYHLAAREAGLWRGRHFWLQRVAE